MGPGSKHLDETRHHNTHRVTHSLTRTRLTIMVEPSQHTLSDKPGGRAAPDNAHASARTSEADLCEISVYTCTTTTSGQMLASTWQNMNGEAR